MSEVTVIGVKLVYEVKGEGLPILLICGTLQPAFTWWMFGGDKLVEAGHKVIVFDNRGVPPSDVPPPPYSVSDMADDAIGVMEHLGLGPYGVMGASLGGMIAQTVALRRPDLVRAVVFVVSGGDLCAYTKVQLQGQIDLLKTGAELPSSFLAWAMLESILPPAKLQDDEAVEAAVAMAGVFGTLPRDGMLGQYEADLAWAQEDHVTELAGLEVPALAIAAEHDLAFPPSHVKRAVAQMPDAEYVELKGAPHVAIEHIDETNAAVLAFLAKHVQAGV